MLQMLNVWSHECAKSLVFNYIKLIHSFILIAIINLIYI